jgi:hypothetical protein
MWRRVVDASSRLREASTRFEGSYAASSVRSSLYAFRYSAEEVFRTMRIKVSRVAMRRRVATQKAIPQRLRVGCRGPRIPSPPERR